MWTSKYVPDRLNIGTKDELEATGYMRDPKRLALTILATLLSCGLLLVPLTWRPSFRLSLTHKRCPLALATTVLLKDIHGQEWEEEVVMERRKKEEEKDDDDDDVEKGEREKRESEDQQVYFMNQKIKYIWDETTCTFVKLRPLDYTPTFSKFHKDGSGLTQVEAKRRLKVYGENYLDVGPVSVWRMLVHKVVNPYYICQCVVIIVWLIQHYYLTALTILGLSIASISFSLYQTVSQCQMLRQTVTSQSDVTALRDGLPKRLSSCELVPGDVVLIGTDENTRTDGCGLQRIEMDAVLLDGSVVTNEAMLTGEAIPVTKVCVPRDNDTMFDPVHHRHHILQGGTQLLQVRGGAQLPALVLNTGFYTAKGELVRSILYPKPHHLHLYWDLFWLLGGFVALGLAAFGWSIYSWRSIGIPLGDTILNSLDLIMFVVPPILPAAITTVAAWAQMRLRKQHILTFASNYILPAGSIDVVCFDKTGTLTEEDLGLAGVLPVSGGEFLDPQDDLKSLPPDQPLTRALATCHSLSIVNDSLVGYPVDLKIFSAIDWVLQEMDTEINPHYDLVTPIVARPQAREGVDPGHHELATLRSFPFVSREQRMTVVTRTKVDAVMEVFMKGAPEKLAGLCRVKTVPGLLDAAVEWYTRQGLRVLAVAGKSFREDLSWEEVQDMSRESLEADCVFLGLVVLQNRVKGNTIPTLATLHTAALTTVMITGDNLLTAVSVGRESGVVGPKQQVIIVRAIELETTSKAVRHIKLLYYDSDAQAAFTQQSGKEWVCKADYVFAMDGDTVEMLEHLQDTSIRHRVLQRGRIFARMKPHHKVMVVEALQSMGHHVAMCGDGCNDCGALKVADCGISLSTAEASMAAPFTSQQPDITCVPALLREGRAVIASTLAAVKYNIITCFTALICVIFHYVVHTQPTDHQFVLLALGLMTVPSLVVGCTAPFPYLSPVRPESRLLSPITIASIVSFLGIQTLTYWMMLTYFQAQPWFESQVYDGDRWTPLANHANTCLYTLCCFSVTSAAVVLSHATPFRLPVYTNYVLMGYLTLATFFCTFITFYTDEGLTHFLNLLPFPDVEANGVLFCAAVVCFAVSFVWERWVLYSLVWGRLLPWLRGVCLHGGKLYVRVEEEIAMDTHWPDLSPPPTHHFDQASSLEKLLEKEEEKTENRAAGTETTEFIDEFNFENYGEETMWVRKLSRRHRFQATVRFEAKTADPIVDQVPSPFSATFSGSPTTVSEEPGTKGKIRLVGDGLIAPYESAGYREPIDSIQGRDGKDGLGGSNQFTFNDSIRTQLMKGTAGYFRTFRGTVKDKRHESGDTHTAEPYEVIPLTDTREEEEEEDARFEPDDTMTWPEGDEETGMAAENAPESLYDIPKKPRPLSGLRFPLPPPSTFPPTSPPIPVSPDSTPDSPPM